jgi:hypothetical protein
MGTGTQRTPTSAATKGEGGSTTSQPKPASITPTLNATVPLRRTLSEYARHYNGRRPHRALQLQPPRSDRPVVDLTHERIKRRLVLDGLITEYERAA